MKILTFSKLYPSSVTPEHGVFVARRTAAIASRNGIELKVVAPVPFYPRFLPARGDWKRMQEVPEIEILNGIEVHHPRYFNPAKVGMTKYGQWMASGSRTCIRRLIESGFDFDLIDAHFVYPDGFAAVSLAKEFKRPVVLSARGSDVLRNKDIRSLVPLLRKAISGADWTIAVSEELRDEMLKLGASQERISVIPNGIDAEVFSCLPSKYARRELGIEEQRRWLVSVARLDPNKGQHVIVEALARLGEDFLNREKVRLALVGTGESEKSLRALVQERRLNSFVYFAGQQPQEKVRLWYNAAEVSILASFREGSPNAVLESLASGSPVIASRVGRNEMILTERKNGLLFDAGNSAGLADTIQSALTIDWDRDQIAAESSVRTWDKVAEEVLGVAERFARKS